MLCAVVALSSLASHVAIYLLKIRVEYSGYHQYGAPNRSPATVLHGSSLAYDGLDWGKISQACGSPIETWATPGSSPAEWEIEHRRSKAATRTIIVVSPYDLNEYWLCDFRADIVPLNRTVGDLWHIGADWQFCKRILSQYPMMLVRRVFPTVGRSDGVMTGIRDELQKLAGRGSSDSSESTKFANSDTSESKERVSEWPAAKLQRRMSLMRTRCQGKHAFNGPKNMALQRLLQQAGRHGEIMLIVMPVSPLYHKEFLEPKVLRGFEEKVAELQHCCPQVTLVRVDKLPALEDNDMFKDSVHLNMYGQQIATSALLSRLQKYAAQP
jgi:hypothetical protein